MVYLVLIIMSNLNIELYNKLSTLMASNPSLHYDTAINMVLNSNKTNSYYTKPVNSVYGIGYMPTYDQYGSGLQRDQSYSICG